MCGTEPWEGDAIFPLYVPVGKGTVVERGLLGTFLAVGVPSVALGTTAVPPPSRLPPLWQKQSLQLLPSG